MPYNTVEELVSVPYTTKVVNNDSEVRAFAATNQLVVLDSLIADVENVKGQARNRFSSTADTKGQITNAALYAMLSDMYLWRASLHEGRGIMNDEVKVMQQGGATVAHSVVGDYQLAADYADRAMEKLNEQLEQKMLTSATVFSTVRMHKMPFSITETAMKVSSRYSSTDRTTAETAW